MLNVQADVPIEGVSVNILQGSALTSKPYLP